MNELFNKKSLVLLSILFLILLPSILPLFHHGFFKTDDGEWMIIRFSAFHQALRDGQFPVRFLPRLNFDYGYPVANFLYPGFMYLAEPIHLIGFGFVNTIKIILGLSMIFSGVFTYLWLRKLFSNHAALFGGLLYTYAPYHLYDIYVRGSVGEVLALCVVPFILWQMERKSFIFTTLGLALLILSHNTLAVLFYPVLFLYGLIAITDKKRRKEAIIRLILEFMLGIGIAGFFFLPAILDLHYTVFSQTSISEWRQYFAFAQIRLLGAIISLLLILIIFFVKAVFKKVQKNEKKIQLFFYLFCGVLLISLLMNVPFSALLWSILPIAFIQFPFRLLSLEILAVSYLMAFFLSGLQNKKLYLYGVLGFVFLFAPSLLFLHFTYFDKGEGFYATNEDTTTIKKEYMPIWVKQIPEKHPDEKVILNHGTITQKVIKSNKYSISGNTSQNSILTINTVYFPGWYAKIDGKSVSFHPTDGLLHVDFPSGQHTAIISWKETPVRAISDIISVLSLFLLLFLEFRYYKKTI